MFKPQTLRFNLPLLFTDRFFACFWLITPILVPFYESNGLGATQVFTIQAAFSAALLLFEVPTGYLSDVIGRRNALIFGAAILPLGVIVYALAHNMWSFMLAETVCALAISLRSGTDSALLFDTLLDLKRDKEHKRLEGTGHLLERVGGSLASVLGGLVAVISLRMVFYVNAAAFLVLLPVAFMVREPARKKQEPQKPKEHIIELARAVNYCVRHSDIRNAAIYSGLLASTGIIGIWTYFLYYSKLEINVGYFGLIGAGFGLISGFGGKIAHAIEKKIGRAASLWLPLLIAPNFWLLGQMHSVYALVCVFLNAFLWGFSTPLLRDIAHRHTPSRIRATVMSVISMTGRLGYVLLALPIGVIIDRLSLGTAHMFLGGTCLAIGIFPVLALTMKKRKT